MEVESETANGDTTNGGGGGPVGKPPEPTRRPTFKEKVLGKKAVEEGRKQVRNLVDAGIMKKDLVDGNSYFPMFDFKDDHSYEAICKPFEACLVVQLLGKSIGYKALCEKLRFLWKPVGGFEVRDLHHGYFLIQFDLTEDRERAMVGAPWMIYDHYLAVKPWTPDFVAANSKISTTAVWIRIPGLGFQFYEESILVTLASAVGTPIRVDMNTADMQRGKYARVCVEIDLTKPVLGRVGLRGVWYNIEYKGLHLLCAKCGCYGHLSRKCTGTPVPQPQKTHSPCASVTPATPPVVVDGSVATLEADQQMVTEINAEAEKKGIECPNDAHGDWLSVTRKSRKSTVVNVTQNKPKPTMQKQSRDTGAIHGEKKGVAQQFVASATKLNLGGTMQFHAGSAKDTLPVLGDHQQGRKGYRKESTAMGGPHIGSSQNIPLTQGPNRSSTQDPQSMGNTRIVALADGTRTTLNLQPRDGNRYAMLVDEEMTHGCEQPLQVTGEVPYDPAWNIRGGAGVRGQRRVRDLIRSHHPSLFAVVETHCQFETVASFWRSVGYDLCACSEAVGHRGGIWILAHVGRNFVVQVVDIHLQAVTVSISVDNGAWLCTVVYASPTPSLREGLWSHLMHLRQQALSPWLAVGDFNDISSPTEVLGGDFSAARAARFLEMVEACEFMDLGATGPRFTWERRLNGRRTIAKRLDRAFGDISWRHNFPEAYVENLARVYSDHRPVLVRCHARVEDRSGRPFRFHAAWTTHPYFKPLVRETWMKPPPNLVGKLDNIRLASQEFNVNVFGNITRRKKRVERRLQGLQRELEVRESESLLRLEKELQVEYEQILTQEELTWFQKSREKWVKFGDRNTRFFHTQTVVRRKRNKIHGLYVGDEWCTDSEALKAGV
ncbi:uncharacterized protein LOC130719539 [Lotus japonicus]|uniref:uncharacterized protein LOC130719539 n=1 Tax=Lotus japonicus TaxID=34305 RepID=UPI00258F156F|nr:uncharacterized protein LOC130719539 [Lotus japonicus]